MPRAFHIPGVFFLFCAFALLFLVSVSLPFLPAIDFVRVHFEGSPSTSNGNEGALTQLRVRRGCIFLQALNTDIVLLLVRYMVRLFVRSDVT